MSLSRLDTPLHTYTYYLQGVQAISALIFAPFVAYVWLLFRKPKNSEDVVSPEFISAQYHTIIVHALTGGLESPIQLIYQLWLVLNGIIVIDWNQLVQLSFEDAQGNQIFLPYTASLCIMFSVVSILKAILEFNVSRMHVPAMKSWSTFLISLPVYLDFLPFLATCCMLMASLLEKIFLEQFWRPCILPHFHTCHAHQTDKCVSFNTFLLRNKNCHKPSCWYLHFLNGKSVF